MTLLTVRDPVVLRLGEARAALAKALDIQQVKKIHDVAAASEVYAKRQGLSEEVIGQAHALKIEALGRLGELLKQMPKNVGLKGSRVVSGSKREPLKDKTPAYRDLGVSKKVASVAQQLATLPAETRTAIAEREVKLGHALRSQRKAEQHSAAGVCNGCANKYRSDRVWTGTPGCPGYRSNQ